ncbi:hypothetical protein ACIRS3_17615 [Streptomyces virginiae]
MRRRQPGNQARTLLVRILTEGHEAGEFDVTAPELIFRRVVAARP